MQTGQGSPETLAQVEVWLAEILQARRDLPRWASVLSDDEVRRAESMAEGEARLRFVTGRGLLRHLLAERSGVPPAELRFRYGPAGKPILDGRFGEGVASRLAFSVSHAHQWIAIAVVEGAAEPPEVGIDVEWTAPLRDFDRIVARFASAREQEEYAAIDPGLRQAAFYRWWTRKEALAKGTGLGIARGLHCADLSFSETPLLRAPVCAGTDPPREWLFVTQHLDMGYVFTVAVELRYSTCDGRPNQSPLCSCLGARSSRRLRHPTLPLTQALVVSL